MLLAPLLALQDGSPLPWGGSAGACRVPWSSRSGFDSSESPGS